MKLSVIAVSLLTLLLGGCSDMCGNEVSQKVSSPSGIHVAYVFSRNCGATTGFNTQASVLSATEEPPKEEGNLFISSKQVPLVPQWKNDKVLEISGVGAILPVKQVTTAGGVQVIYAP